jgi:hypothetical protein
MKQDCPFARRDTRVYQRQVKFQGSQQLVNGKPRDCETMHSALEPLGRAFLVICMYNVSRRPGNTALKIPCSVVK